MLVCRKKNPTSLVVAILLAQAYNNTQFNQPILSNKGDRGCFLGQFSYKKGSKGYCNFNGSYT